MEYLEKMLYISHFKKLLIWFTIVIIVIEILVRIFPVYKFEKTEKFLLTSVKNQIESGVNNYDIIILGDSRSMSLNPGQFKNIYNFSLPAMGTRYYKYFVKKYIKYNKKPKAVLFAGSPTLVFSGKGSPIVDNKLLSYVTPDMTLSEYLYKRSIERIFYSKEPLFFQSNSFNTINNNEMLWEFFGHRFLLPFNTLEISEIYKGPEWFFVVSQSIPLNYYTYRYRDAIKNIFNIENYKREKNFYGEDYCTCDKLFLKECQPPTSRVQDNEILEQYRKKYNGFYNISDRISKEQQFQWDLRKEEQLKTQMEQANSVPLLNFSLTKEFIEYLESNNILYIYMNTPFPDYYKDSVYITTFYKGFKKFISKFPRAKIFHLPNEFLNRNLFSDQVHLNCEGAKQLNIEFQTITLPEILEYINKNQMQ